MNSARRLELIAPSGLPLIKPGDDLAEIIIDRVRANGQNLQPADIVVIAQKIVSKSENRYVSLAGVKPSEAARSLAQETQKDPRLVELILGESRAVLRHGRSVGAGDRSIGES